MEPFTISCLVLVFCCGYLTVSDLLKDLQMAPAVAMQIATAQIKTKVTTGGADQEDIRH